MKKRKLLVAGLTLLMVSALSAQPATETRSFMKSLPLNRDSRLEVKNKYGDIHFNIWNKDSVYILAEVEAFAPNHAKIQKMFDGININITGTSALVRAETEFTKDLTILLESFKGLTEKIIDYDSRVQINYFISVPERIDINVQNHFGDVSMENNSGVVSVSLSNGDFKANSLNRLADLTLNFGDAEIGSVRSGRINTTFSKMVISESDELNINSTSTRFEMRRAGKITVESRRDKFFAGNLSELGGISYFTDFKIDNLVKTADLTLKYGSLEAEGINNNFESIKLVSAYSDITIAFEPSVSYDFEVRHTNAFVVLPERNSKYEKEVLNENKKEYMITGKVGGNPGGRKVRIEASRGNIYIK
jgi:hypothetical protein